MLNYIEKIEFEGIIVEIMIILISFYEMMLSFFFISENETKKWK